MATQWTQKKLQKPTARVHLGSLPFPTAEFSAGWVWGLALPARHQHSGYKSIKNLRCCPRHIRIEACPQPRMQVAGALCVHSQSRESKSSPDSAAGDCTRRLVPQPCDDSEHVAIAQVRPHLRKRSA